MSLSDSKHVLKILEATGLKLTQETGGQFLGSFLVIEPLEKGLNYYRGQTEDQKDILFISPDIFLRTVQMTESSLSMKLFG
ncbi:MAG: hypothetical protein AB7F28_03105 [Candidatus Margulisiibacteriota bacterium]